MTGFETGLPPRAARGEVSAKRTEGSWGGAGLIEASIHFGSEKRLIDGLEDDLGLNQYVVVPKAQDSEPARPEKHVSTPVVVGLFGMLAPVQLDDERSLKTREVADIRSDRVLSAKFELSQLASTHTLPKHALCMSRGFAKGPREAKHAPTEPLIAGISVAEHNLRGQRVMTPPALRATSPASLERQAVVVP